MKKEDYVKEIEHLIYDKPKCDFEHIWNTAIDKALEIFDTE